MTSNYIFNEKRIAPTSPHYPKSVSITLNELVFKDITDDQKKKLRDFCDKCCPLEELHKSHIVSYDTFVQHIATKSGAIIILNEYVNKFLSKENIIHNFKEDNIVEYMTLYYETVRNNKKTYNLSDNESVLIGLEFSEYCWGNIPYWSDEQYQEIVKMSLRESDMKLFGRDCDFGIKLEKLRDFTYSSIPQLLEALETPEDAFYELATYADNYFEYMGIDIPYSFCDKLNGSILIDTIRVFYPDESIKEYKYTDDMQPDTW